VSLAERGIPGMKVMRWERNWHAEGQPFYDLTAYRDVSVATSGTHDTETMAEWWDNAPVMERQAVLSLPIMRDAGLSPDAPFSDRTRDALLDVLFASGSRLLILPIQDIFGWRDRINTPALVNDQNWTWRLPLPVDDLMTDGGANERAAFLGGLSQKYGRS
jgi:4-alpha-glucanotransferase